ncbi:hypothetical protein HK096_004495, partial [Nowakowskiella sp. JEL0078]
FSDMNDEFLISGIAKNCLNLKDLSLAECESLSDEGRTLRSLNINGLDELTDSSLKMLASPDIEGFPNILRELNVSWVRNIDDDIFLQIMKNLVDLESIWVWGCGKLTEFTLGMGKAVFTRQSTIICQQKHAGKFCKVERVEIIGGLHCPVSVDDVVDLVRQDLFMWFDRENLLLEIFNTCGSAW